MMGAAQECRLSDARAALLLQCNSMGKKGAKIDCECTNAAIFLCGSSKNCIFTVQFSAILLECEVHSATTFGLQQGVQKE